MRIANVPSTQRAIYLATTISADLAHHLERVPDVNSGGVVTIDGIFSMRGDKPASGSPPSRRYAREHIFGFRYGVVAAHGRLSHGGSRPTDETGRGHREALRRGRQDSWSARR